MRRLSIIDIKGEQQPIKNENGKNARQLFQARFSFD